MQLEIFCLCKDAFVNALNQPTIIRVFDKKIAKGEPALIDPFVVVASIRFFQNEVGTHRFEFVCRNEAGALILESKEIINIDHLDEDSTTYFLRCGMPARVSPFGIYWFSIEAAGKPLARIPLYVLRDNT